MNPIIFDARNNLTDILNDNSNGLGRIDVTRCVVIEERNGMYEMEFDISTNDIHFNDLEIGGIVKCTGYQDSGLQMFRIYKIEKPINEICTVYAQHISYDMNKIAVKPFNTTGVQNAVNGIVSNMLGTYPFTITTNIDNTTSKFIIQEPRTMRECLGGEQGSLLDVFSSRGIGEFLWNNLEVKFLDHRGSDNDVRISYGKNLTDFKQEESIENVYDAIVGFATVNDITTTGDVQNITGATYPRTMIVDFSQEFDENNPVTKTKLNTYATQYAERNRINVPSVSLDVSFVNLAQTEEYKDIAPLERVQLCDTVHVFFPKLNVEATAKVIRTEWNVLLERYDSIELGDAKSTISSTIQDTFINPLEKKTASSNSIVTDEMNTMAQLILNGLGLFKTNVPQANGSVKIYMHNRPELSDSNIQYVIGENGFLVSTNYGRTWNSGIDADGNAVFNSLSANTIKAMNIYGSTIDGSRFTSEHKVSSGDTTYMNLWSGVFEQQWNNYVRTLIYSTSESPYIILEGGNETDGNVIPTNDFRAEISKRSIAFIKNNDSSKIGSLFIDDSYNFTMKLGDSFVKLYGNGTVQISNGDVGFNIGSDNSISMTKGNCWFGIDTDNSMFMFNQNGSISLTSTGEFTIDVKKLNVYFNGRGYDNLGFVNDGNGHAVIGK